MSLKKILLLALGGEGGGTLTEWVVEAGLASAWPIQATSIPGVAQRTGATSYYIECLPRSLRENEKAPPMCLAPLAGDLDLIVSSELLETARAAEKGFPDPRRTLVMSSTTRALTVDERSGMADARLDSKALEQTIRAQVKQLHLLDMTEIARREGTVVSAVMFGTLVGSGVLPFSKEICAQVIAKEGSGVRAAASLKGFQAGYAAVKDSAGPLDPQETQPELVEPQSPKPQGVASSKDRLLCLETVLELGMARLTDFQDAAYAQQYRAIVERFMKLDHSPFEVSQEAARTLALWMAYEDVIRVADLKTRRSRFEQIRRDYRAKDGEPVVVRDFLKPGVDEIAAILPPKWAAAVKRWAAKHGKSSFGEGIQMATSSVGGLLAMRSLASLRFLRRSSSRFIEEQALIGRWAACLEAALAKDADLAQTVAELPKLIKGYSDTFVRGHGNFVRILENLLEPGLLHLKQGTQAARQISTQFSSQLRAALGAAQANPDGAEVFRVLGLPQPAPKEQVLRFAKPMVRPRS